jgi:uncharacterized damage-inducible protein DinB
MKFQLEEAINILQRTPGVLRGLLQDLPDHWVLANYGPDTFSPFDVIGHLIHGEQADWIPRMRVILEHGESKPFQPFDRYAMYDASKGKSIRQLLDEFERARGESLTALREAGLIREQLQKCGTHPALGMVTLEQLLATWVTHDLHHIAQICKAMARQYKDEVGPWRAYVSILG